MNSIGVPSKPVMSSVTPVVSPDPHQSQPVDDRRVVPVLKAAKTDTYTQRQAPPKNGIGPDGKPGKDHVAPPSALQLKITSMLQKQAEAQYENVEPAPVDQAPEKKTEEPQSKKVVQEETSEEHAKPFPAERPYEGPDAIAVTDARSATTHKEEKLAENR